MKPEEFDDLYPHARSQLVLEAFALTGDLAASRSAVRDGFVILAHHWRKANRTGDPVEWLREDTWDRAHRHHQTHVWQRDPQLPDDVRGVLAALSVLSPVQRKALVGAEIAGLRGDDLSRLVGLPGGKTDQALAQARADLASLLEVDTDQAIAALSSLHEVTETLEWPRPSLLRHTGVARRRTHSIVGAIGAAAVLVLAGTAVSVGTHDRVNLDAERVTASQEPTVTGKTALLDDANLLDVAAVRPVARKLSWQQGQTTDNRGESAIMAPCMTERFADKWAGLDSSVREFSGSGGGGQQATVTQFVELSESAPSARKAYQRMRSWFGSCNEPRFQLLKTSAISRVGAEGTQFRFLDWNKPQRNVTVNVARTGRTTITTVDVLTAVRKPGNAVASAQVLADAVDLQCASAVATECALPPRLSTIPPLAIGPPRSFLKELDLPPVTNAPSGWGGTPVTVTNALPSVATCADLSLKEPAVTRVSSRTFVFPKMAKSTTFGLTQAVVRLKTGAAGAAYFGNHATKLANCEETERGTVARQISLTRTPSQDIGVWHLTVDLSDDSSLQMLVSMARVGNQLTQVTFVPDAQHSLSEPVFLALTERAAERLAIAETKKPIVDGTVINK